MQLVTNAKLFPSTHVVYEGIGEIKTDIDEEETTKPLLSYSLSKSANETQIKNSGKNYNILRLGSVHGYPNDNENRYYAKSIFKIASQMEL